MEPYVYTLMTPEALGTGAYLISGICGLILLGIAGTAGFFALRDARRAAFRRQIDRNMKLLERNIARMRAAETDDDYARAFSAFMRDVTANT